MAPKILIVDDLEKLSRIIAKDFELIGYSAFYAIEGTTGLRILKEKNIDIVLLDLKLGDENGIDILKEMKQLKPDVPVFMITGHGTIANAVDAIKNGAHDYIQKPVNFEKLRKMVENAVNLGDLKKENLRLKKLLRQKSPGVFMTVNPTMLEILEKLKKFAETDYTIFIEGESGTGKELLAEYIHAHSARKDRDFYKINCAAFSESLLDDELFGHNKGAFTGADSEFKGIFERADNATLFLDEIGDMSLAIQAKILRTLQNREVRRLGGKHNVIVDIRFIAATNKNIRTMVEEGTFRKDLFFRLNTAMISVPPLRDRKDDIEILSRLFLTESASQIGCEEKRIEPMVFDFFRNYPWPGNIRELKNVINYANTISRASIIGIGDLPQYLLRGSHQIVVEQRRKDEGERLRIMEALSECKYNKSKAAEILDMSRRTLYNKMEKYGIDG